MEFIPCRCNRQRSRRIDMCEIIVLERSSTILYGGSCSDIYRVETPGTVTGKGFSNQGMPEQRAIGSGMVQATGDHTNYILSLGARSTVCCWQHGTAGRTGQGCLCKSADAKAGMPQRSRTFRYAVCRECENGYLSVVWEGAAENIG